VLSLFPGLLLMAAALGSLDRLVGATVAERSEAAVVRFLSEVLTDRASGVVAAVHDLFERERGGLMTTALLLGLWVLMRGFAAVIRALDRIYGQRERRGLLELAVTQLGFALGSIAAGALLLSMLVVGPLFGHGPALAARLGLGGLFGFAWSWLRGPLAIALLIVWSATLYRWGPSGGSPWKRGLPGALGAALMWVGVSIGFRTYLHTIGAMNQVFGVLGGGLILLVWLYLLNLALLLGAALNVVMWEMETPAPADPIDDSRG